MITHNGKYLLHATHHGMPIVAATMGGKMILDGKWLQPATQLAILAAFGAEGIEVIAKTNDYLNRIATTDPQRALLLAGFINEDPMLVCSLVETSKTRWLVGDGKAYINTGVLGNSSLNISAEMNVLFNTDSAVAIGARNGSNGRFGLVFIYGGNWYLGVGYTDGSIKSVALNKEYHYKGEIGISGYRFYENGVQIAQGATTCDTNLTMYLFAYNYNGGIQYPMIGKMDGCLIKSNDQPVRHFAPFQLGKDWSADKVSIGVAQSAGTNGMLDIISGTFYPNANTQGSFTIQLTSKTTETTS